MQKRTLVGVILAFVVGHAACSSTVESVAHTGGAAGSTVTTSTGAAGSTTTSSTTAPAGAGGSSSTTGPGGSAGASSGAGGSADDGGPGVGGAGGAGGTGGAGGGQEGGTPGVRAIAYLPNYSGSFGTWAKKINFAKMTHLNLAFATATGTNDWSMGASDADVKAIVDAAHAAGTLVLASLGGGGGDQSVIARYRTPSNIDDLVAKLDAFLKAHDLDGADIDIEDPSNLGANYSTFVDKTAAKLKPEGKLVTAAVAQYLQSSMSDATLHQFDFINVMIYSNMQQTVTDVNYYLNTKNVPKDRIVLGAAFFGTDSGGNEYAYADIMRADPNAWQKDQTQVGGKPVKYTGMMSMAALTQYSKTIGGIMFWELSEDTFDEHALWKVIQDNL